MKPRPTFNPHPESSIPYPEAKRSFDAELMAWAAEMAQNAAERADPGALDRQRLTTTEGETVTATLTPNMILQLHLQGVISSSETRKLLGIDKVLKTQKS